MLRAAVQREAPLARARHRASSLPVFCLAPGGRRAAVRPRFWARHVHGSRGAARGGCTSKFLAPTARPDAKLDRLWRCDLKPFKAREMNVRTRFQFLGPFPSPGLRERAVSLGRAPTQGLFTGLVSVVEDAVRLPARVEARTEFASSGFFCSGPCHSPSLRLAVECPVMQRLSGAWFPDELERVIDLSDPSDNAA